MFSSFSSRSLEVSKALAMPFLSPLYWQIPPSQALRNGMPTGGSPKPCRNWLLRWDSNESHWSMRYLSPFSLRYTASASSKSATPRHCIPASRRDRHAEAWSRRSTFVSSPRILWSSMFYYFYNIYMCVCVRCSSCTSLDFPAYIYCNQRPENLIKAQKKLWALTDAEIALALKNKQMFEEVTCFIIFTLWCGRQWSLWIGWCCLHWWLCRYCLVFSLFLLYYY